VCVIFFFFSSRRRHTRFSRDWSSDVCSSDLGWTPVAGALESAKESFAGLDAETNTNLIYLVSDGIETCDGDPVAAAKNFADSDRSEERRVGKECRSRWTP